MYALVFVLGFLGASAWTGYIQAVTRGRAAVAAAMDGVVVGLSLVTTQLWALMGDDAAVLACFLLGSMAGTYLVVKRSASERIKPCSDVS